MLSNLKINAPSRAKWVRRKVNLGASDMQVAVARQLAAARLDRRADLMLLANLPMVAERLSSAAQAMREGTR